MGWVGVPGFLTLGWGRCSWWVPARVGAALSSQPELSLVPLASRTPPWQFLFQDSCRRFVFQHHSCSHPREVSCRAESFTSSLYRSCLSDGTINIVFNYTALQYSAILQFLCVVLENKLNCRLFKTAFLRFQ